MPLPETELERRQGLATRLADLHPGKAWGQVEWVEAYNRLATEEEAKRVIPSSEADLAKRRADLERQQRELEEAEAQQSRLVGQWDQLLTAFEELRRTISEAAQQKAQLDQMAADLDAEIASNSFAGRTANYGDPKTVQQVVGLFAQRAAVRDAIAAYPGWLKGAEKRFAEARRVLGEFAVAHDVPRNVWPEELKGK